MDNTANLTSPRRISCQEDAGDGLSIVLQGSVTIEDARDIQSVLSEALSSGRNIVMHGGEIEKVDTAVIQLLCSFVNEVRQLRHAVAWSSASDVLIQVATWLGMAGALTLEQAEPVPIQN